MSKFSENLKYLRKREHISQAEFSDKTGLSRSAVAMYESGKREPGFETLELIADFFNVDLDFLTGRSGMERPFFIPEVPGAFEINETRKIPLLGQIAAGLPLYAEENLEGYIWTEKNHGAEYFGLRVVGDSMNAAGIKNGDIVIVRKQEAVQPNEIAVVRVDGDYATIKRFQQQGDIVILNPQSTNPDNQPQTYSLKDHTISIIGKVVESRTEF